MAGKFDFNAPSKEIARQYLEGLDNPAPQQDDPALQAALAATANVPGRMVSTGKAPPPRVSVSPQDMKAYQDKVAASDTALREGASAKGIFAGPPQPGAGQQKGVVVPRPQVIPAHWQPGSKTTQLGVQLSPDAIANMQGANTAVGQAANAYGQAAQNVIQHQGDQSSLLAQQAAAIDANNQHLNAVRQNNDADLGAQRSSIRRATEDLSDNPVDPDRFMKNQSAGQRIMFALAAGLGGFAEGMGRGAKNRAFEQINAMIDRDISAQKDSFNAKRAKVADMQTAYGLSAQEYKSDEERILNSRAMIQEGYAAKLKALQADVENPIQAAKLQESAANLLASAAQNRAQLDALSTDKVTQSEHYSPTQVVGGAAPGSQPFDAKPNQLVDMGNGTHMVADSGDAADKIKARRAFENQIGALQTQAKDVYKKYGKTVAIPGTDGYRQMQIIREQAIPIQSLATQQGVVREFERDPTLRGLGLAYGGKDLLTGSDFNKNIETSQKTLKLGSEEMLKQHAGPIVRQQYVTNQHGQVVPQYIFLGPGGAQAAAPPAAQTIPGFKPVGGQ